jgi:hypothetical protein
MGCFQIFTFSLRGRYGNVDLRNSDKRECFLKVPSIFDKKNSQSLLCEPLMVREKESDVSVAIAIV